MYLWKEAEGEVLYVGKAKRLRSRVRSYFAGDFPDSPKNRLLQRLIADVETIVVPSEPESLMLENNLIKEYRPRFNVRLKDDKSYPSIAVTLGEPFPRVLVTRKRDIPGARYFGPYTDVGQLRRTLAIIRRLYTVRSCQDELPRGPPGAALSRLLHRPLPGALHGMAGHAGLPAHGRTTCVDFLEGRTQDVRSRVREAMLEASEREDFERAREMRDALRWLDRLDEPARVEVMGTGDADVVGYARDGDDAVGVLIRVRGRPSGGAGAPLPRGRGGGGGRRRPERVPGALLRAGRRPRAPARAPVPPSRVGHPAASCSRTPTGRSRSGERRSAGSSWPTRMRGICSRACGSSRSRPRSGPRIRSTRWVAISG